MTKHLQTIICRSVTSIKRAFFNTTVEWVVVMQPSHTPQLPHLLKPGELWQGVVSQPQLESYLNEHGDKLVYVAVAHVCSHKEVMQRVDTSRLRERLDVLGD